MTIEQLDKIVRHQTDIFLQERGLSKNDIGEKQYSRELYQMALKIIMELKK